jgi:predicted Zn-dependent protease
MKKIFFQFLTIVVVFIGTLIIFQQIDWIKLFEVKKISKKTENKLGDLYWEVIKKINYEVKSEKIKEPIQDLVDALIKANGIESEIKLHVVKKDEVNAFALPNGHLIVYSGLVDNCKNPEELCGVLGHEIAHIDKNHVMKKLVKEVGLSALLSIASGKGGEVLKETAKKLTSSAYDRSLETEADLTSVEYLIEAQIDPGQFANFLKRMAKAEKGVPDQIFWLSTHPDLEKRADAILDEISTQKFEFKPVLADSIWIKLKSDLNSHFKFN